jgi:hypothetical protein
LFTAARLSELFHRFTEIVRRFLFSNRGTGGLVSTLFAADCIRSATRLVWSEFAAARAADAAWGF